MNELVIGKIHADVVDSLLVTEKDEVTYLQPVFGYFFQTRAMELFPRTVRQFNAKKLRINVTDKAGAVHTFFRGSAFVVGNAKILLEALFYSQFIAADR